MIAVKQAAVRAYDAAIRAHVAAVHIRRAKTEAERSEIFDRARFAKGAARMAARTADSFAETEAERAIAAEAMGAADRARDSFHIVLRIVAKFA